MVFSGTPARSKPLPTPDDIAISMRSRIGRETVVSRWAASSFHEPGPGATHSLMHPSVTDRVIYA